MGSQVPLLQQAGACFGSPAFLAAAPSPEESAKGNGWRGTGKGTYLGIEATGRFDGFTPHPREQNQATCHSQKTLQPPLRLDPEEVFVARETLNRFHKHIEKLPAVPGLPYIPGRAYTVRRRSAPGDT